MTLRQGSSRKRIPMLFASLLLVLAISSCAKGGSSQPEGGAATKLPPGMTSSGGTSEATGAVENTSQDTAAASTGAPSETGAAGNQEAKTVTLSGVEFTVLSAKREDDNSLVSASGQRKVSGDFLEVELRIKNAGESLVSLSRFSFRLWNPHIKASTYDDYYGNVTAYGAYVSRNTISAALLDYSSLRQVSYTLRIGEELEDVFLFFDLNPLSVSRNEGFTKEESRLVFYDTETGGKEEVDLSGFTD